MEFIKQALRQQYIASLHLLPELVDMILEYADLEMSIASDITQDFIESLTEVKYSKTDKWIDEHFIGCALNLHNTLQTIPCVNNQVDDLAEWEDPYILRQLTRTEMYQRATPQQQSMINSIVSDSYFCVLQESAFKCEVRYDVSFTSCYHQSFYMTKGKDSWISEIDLSDGWIENQCDQYIEHAQFHAQYHSNSGGCLIHEIPAKQLCLPCFQHQVDGYRDSLRKERQIIHENLAFIKEFDKVLLKVSSVTPSKCRHCSSSLKRKYNQL